MSNNPDAQNRSSYNHMLQNFNNIVRSLNAKIEDTEQKYDVLYVADGADQPTRAYQQQFNTALVGTTPYSIKLYDVNGRPLVNNQLTNDPASSNANFFAPQHTPLNLLPGPNAKTNGAQLPTLPQYLLNTGFTLIPISQAEPNLSTGTTDNQFSIEEHINTNQLNGNPYPGPITIPLPTNIQQSLHLLQNTTEKAQLLRVAVTLDLSFTPFIKATTSNQNIVSYTGASLINANNIYVSTGTAINLDNQYNIITVPDGTRYYYDPTTSTFIPIAGINSQQNYVTWQNLSNLIPSVGPATQYTYESPNDVNPQGNFPVNTVLFDPKTLNASTFPLKLSVSRAGKNTSAFQTILPSTTDTNTTIIRVDNVFRDQAKTELLVPKSALTTLPLVPKPNATTQVTFDVKQQPLLQSALIGTIYGMLFGSPSVNPPLPIEGTTCLFPVSTPGSIIGGTIITSSTLSVGSLNLLYLNGTPATGFTTSFTTTPSTISAIFTNPSLTLWILTLTSTTCVFFGSVSTNNIPYYIYGTGTFTAFLGPQNTYTFSGTTLSLYNASSTFNAVLPSPISGSISTTPVLVSPGPIYTNTIVPPSTLGSSIFTLPLLNSTNTLIWGRGTLTNQYDMGSVFDLPTSISTPPSFSLNSLSGTFTNMACSTYPSSDTYNFATEFDIEVMPEDYVLINVVSPFNFCVRNGKVTLVLK